LRQCGLPYRENDLNCLNGVEASLSRRESGPCNFTALSCPYFSSYFPALVALRYTDNGSARHDTAARETGLVDFNAVLVLDPALDEIKAEPWQSPPGEPAQLVDVDRVFELHCYSLTPIFRRSGAQFQPSITAP